MIKLKNLKCMYDLDRTEIETFIKRAKKASFRTEVIKEKELQLRYVNQIIKELDEILNDCCDPKGN